MRDIGIIGAGQAGLQLGFGLLEKGYTVTVYSDRTPEQIFNARLAATTYLFGRAHQYEQELGLDFWKGPGEYARGGDLDVCAAPGQRAIRVQGRILNPGKSLDLRAKYSRWLAEFERRGGSVVVRDVDVDALEVLATGHDLVVVTTGRNSFTRLFERDAERSVHTQPPRNLAAMIVTGMKPLHETPYPALKFILTAGHGEYFAMPYFDRIRGPLNCLLLEAIPGQGLDRFGGVSTAREAMERMKQVLRDFSPWVAERLEGASIVDESSWLTGAFTPTVRKPVGRLPSGRTVMGMGDVVMLNDPIAGQGLNSASKQAHAMTQAILAHGDQPFTPDWMEQTFEHFWRTEGQFITAFTNMLLQPPPPHVLRYLGAASAVSPLADMFFDNFGEPQRFWPWIASPDETEARIQHAAAA
ncbi:FAD-binding oxidoreductase [Corallococcus sp. AB045]|uniref:styrene monooxygenase/indole monooxygenase family protein n=1 Tax=Corallococcus sp. AB045 TaxID=2316719 RepID=UPI000EEE6926|nr:styrene monooxygenase/indole monooxygenase family protein [Corallococcus sp. AB045]RKH86969.1 FAD-binding oxidoreductase [Corallococcus sp. AB045]